MLAKRIVPCLDIRGGRVVKGTRFENLRDAGDPAELAARYCNEGADEIVVLDVAATLEERLASLATIQRIAANVDVPLTVGGGVGSIDDVEALLRAGADKVALNSAAVANPVLLSRAAERFGSQCVVISIDAAREGAGYRVRTRSGTTPCRYDAIEWAKVATQSGAGEVLLTSIDRDGTLDGYDLALIRGVVAVVDVPVVASGGASSAKCLVDAFHAGADAALAASIFHDRRVAIDDVKELCQQHNVEVRR